nr:MAG TPA: hypothetical protein [Caudoviricetes sp.]
MTSTANLELDVINGSDFISPDIINKNFAKVDAVGKDYIIEQGTSGEWWYRKWKSGRAECGIDYKDFGNQTLSSSNWPSFYMSGLMSFGAYPFAFSKRPYTSIRFLNDSILGTGRVSFVVEAASTSTTISPNFMIADASSGNCHPFFGIYVTGYYK